MGATKCILVTLLLVAAAAFAAKNGDTLSDNSNIDIAIEGDDSTTLSSLYPNLTVFKIGGDANDTDVNDEDAAQKNYGSVKCKNGMVLPVWMPIDKLTFGDRFSRGLVYFFLMCYLFLGVSIVSDKFMAAIEKITADERQVTIRKADGTKATIMVRVWNETVANLTLMALGTSAPEILLSIIEIFGNKFHAGDLGPGTIVGSAAYNLFAIISICIMVIVFE